MSDDDGYRARHDHHADADGAPVSAPLGEEAVRLIAAAQTWLSDTVTTAAHADYSGTTCQWCPLCQFAAVLRGERPDVTERVAEAGAAVAGAFRALLEATTRPPSGDAGAGPDAPPDAGEHPRATDNSPKDTAFGSPSGSAPRVQHIRLGEDEGPDDASPAGPDGTP